MDLRGIVLNKTPAIVTTLAYDDTAAFNTLSQPQRIQPMTADWQLADDPIVRTFPPHSFTVVDIPLKP